MLSGWAGIQSDSCDWEYFRRLFLYLILKCAKLWWHSMKLGSGKLTICCVAIVVIVVVFLLWTYWSSLVFYSFNLTINITSSTNITSKIISTVYPAVVHSPVGCILSKVQQTVAQAAQEFTIIVVVGKHQSSVTGQFVESVHNLCLTRHTVHISR